MELKGFKRQRRDLAVGAAAIGLGLAGVVVTAPIAAAQDTEAWTMPALKGEVLQDAVDSVTAAAGEENVTLSIFPDGMNQVIYNYTNWLVCSQSPAAETAVEIGREPKTIYMAVKRPSEGC
ncbi:hypothetical protein C6A85_89980 [Mycobacterium sp. ITM-2017-0098]|nr:hypothetical protein C6A85_89980 [Mycobacterium sp. ITM-2017-0098]